MEREKNIWTAAASQTLHLTFQLSSITNKRKPDVSQLGPLRHQVEVDPLAGPLQSDRPDKQDHQNHIGEDGSEINHFACGFNTLREKSDTYLKR